MAGKKKEEEEGKRVRGDAKPVLEALHVQEQVRRSSEIRVRSSRSLHSSLDQTLSSFSRLLFTIVISIAANCQSHRVEASWLPCVSASTSSSVKAC